MTQTAAALAVLLGLLVRLALPILVTALVIAILRQLDARWQSEARYTTLQVEKPQCWKTKGCTPAQQKVCPAARSPLPCWQVFRLPNGYLREQCLTCDVLARAPLPSLV
jgi:hypothetical protein